MSKKTPHSRRVRTGALALALLVCLPLASESLWSQPAKPAAKRLAKSVINPEGYAELEGIWRPASIPVCWETGADAFGQQKNLVEEAVRLHIQGVKGTSIRFNGWKTCTAADNGIRVTVADAWPVSYVGRQWQRDAAGKMVMGPWNRPVPIPTRMTLNFQFETAFTECRESRDHCIRVTAVHEFMHALGILHEHLRADASDECKKMFPGHGDFKGYKPMPVGDYDDDSFMNYCRNIYDEIRLSEGDMAILRKFYAEQ